MADRDVMRLMRAARQDDAGAQVALARLYLDGVRGLPQDAKAAYVWLLRAAEAGSAEARHVLCERIPAAVIDQPERVMRWFQLAARHGALNARKVLAEWMLSGLVPQAGADQAIGLIESVAEQGDVGAQLKAAHWWDSNHASADAPARATHWFERAASAGSVAAQQALAERLWNQAPRQAQPWLVALAAREDALACARLGQLLFEDAHHRDAAPLLERAAKAGNADAAFHLGQLYASSRGRRESGVPHSYKRAALWWDRAAQAGKVDAAFALYRLYSNRSFSLRDPVTAHVYLTMAAERGHAEAQYLRGMSARRQRVSMDADVTAAGWLQRAADQNYGPAVQALRELCPDAPVVDEALARQRAALLHEIARSDLCLATRLEVGCAFGLTVREALALELARADRGHCLVVERKERGRTGAARRLYRVHPGTERKLLDRAHAVLALESRPPSRLPPWKARFTQLRSLLPTTGLGLRLLDPAPLVQSDP
jgi:TPR repeat protein